jgi:Ca2+-binding RTX toxin-like protein
VAGNDVDSLWGGVGDDYLSGDNGNDLLYGDAGLDTLTGGADSDLLYGGAGNDSLEGSFGHDRLFGEAGNDTLLGGFDNDYLDGGNGNDYLLGSTGNDVFAFSYKPNARTNIDTIAAFNPKYDTIYLENSVFKALGRKGTPTKPAPLSKSMFSVGLKIDSKNDHIIYDKKGGILYYDDDGTGSHKATPFAIVGKNLALTYHDFFVI